MDLLYISTFMFFGKDGSIYGLPSCADSFFEKYLDVFDNVHVIGEPPKSYLSQNAFIEIKNPRITVNVLPPNTSPKDFINDCVIKKELYRYIKNADAILIKPATRRGMMAIKIAEKLGKPYMIEMTGDIHNALRQHPNPLKRLYAPFFYYKIKKSISKTKFGLYVSKDYLQKQFPIQGKMCGCADVILRDFSPTILERRIKKISDMQQGDRINLALIGFYQGKMKGVDTAIRALGLLPKNIHLSILGNGTEGNRKKWYAYGEKNGVYGRIHFPEPLPSSDAVMAWLDTMDIFVFPTRSEGFGRCVAEALARACPTFATDICTMPELLSPNCLFPIGDYKSLSEMIINTINDKEKMKTLARDNFIRAQEYEFEILKRRRDNFLKEFSNYCELCNK